MAGILILFFAAVFLILAGRFFYIQATGTANGVDLNAWAENIRTTSHNVEASRGGIYDSNGMALAYNEPEYEMYAIIDESYSENAEEPLHVAEPVKTAETLAPILDVETDQILEPLQTGKENGRFQVEFGSMADSLSKSQKDRIEELNLPGIEFTEHATRSYPNGVFASHIIGFAREEPVQNDEGETERKLTGVAGMENQMNDVLRGEDGFITYEQDSYNDRLPNPNEVVKPPEDGDDVYLTIDQKVQTLVEDALTQVEEEYQPERINAAVMDPETGEVLAMSTRPSYDPNEPGNVENWYNDIISSPFEPGSTVKMFTWAAAIEAGVYNGNELFQSGTYRYDEGATPIHDHNNGAGWGLTSYNEGFERSSNVAAAKLVWEKMGPETFLEYLKAFDFDEKTGIDLPGERVGQILYNWPLEQITTSFGQGSTATPIQQMKAATAIANDGQMMKPYVIDRTVDSSTEEVINQKSPEVVGTPISESTSSQVRELLSSVVHGEHGTAQKYQLEDYSAGGKSGTAQIPAADGGYLAGNGNYVYSFLGMAPIDDPELITFVSVQQPELEAGETGSDPVAFIFKNVMENALHYLNVDPDMENAGDDTVSYLEVPALKGANPAETEEKLKSQGHNKVTVVGEGEEIVAANVSEGDQVYPNQRVILVTNEPTMPDITGWSTREIGQLTDLIGLHVETFGSGFAVNQNIETGTPITENDYLGVELGTSALNTEETSEAEGETEEEFQEPEMED